MDGQLQVVKKERGGMQRLIDKLTSIDKYRRGDESWGNYCIIVPDTQLLCTYRGCPGSGESARVRCWRANEKLFGQEESRVEKAGDVQVEGWELVDSPRRTVYCTVGE